MDDSDRDQTVKSPHSHPDRESDPSSRSVDTPSPDAGASDGVRLVNESTSRTPWLNATDGPIIQTSTTPIRQCPNCGTPVPLDATACSRCGRFTPAHKSARKRLKKSDVDKLIEQAKIDYQPSTATEHQLCENLGLTLAELKNARPGSVDHQRLLGAVQSILAMLESARSTRPEPTIDYSSLSPEDLERRALELVRISRSMRLPPLGEAPFVEGTTVDSDQNATVPPEGSSLPASEIVEPGASCESALPDKAEPTCEFCHQSISRCREIQETRLSAWRSLHWNDPSEIRRRDDLATQEMLVMADQPYGQPNRKTAAWFPDRDPFEGLTPEDREREIASRDVRRKLGWER